MRWMVSILLLPMLFIANEVGAFSLTDAQAEIESLKAMVGQTQTNLDHTWTMVAAGLVFLMQGGFLLLEAGLVRSKNSISVAQKNIADFVVAGVIFYLIGFGLMFGPSIGGWLGWGMSAVNGADDWHYTFFVFQMVFCGTAATIVSGAVAERMSFHGYLILAAMIAAVIYPVFGHWAWGNLLVGDNEPWLASQGFIDFAGSTVVHSAGGWVALAAIIVIGPRLGKFDQDGNVLPINGHSAVLATLGAILLWVGWIGFNGGSTTAGTSDFAKIVFNTMLSGAFGGTVAMMLGRKLDGLFRPDRSINGVLGALVGITAGCDAVSPYSAVFIGISSGLIVVVSQEIIERVFKLDDAVGAVSVHGVCGAWGTIMAGALAMEDKLGAASRLEQVIVQTEGVVVGFIWMFGTAYVLLKIIDKFFPLRVSKEEEAVGLNTAEHGVTLGTGALQSAMEALARGEGDLNKRLDETTGDEAAELAFAFNQVMAKLDKMVGSVARGASKLVGASLDLRNASAGLESGANSIADRARHVDGQSKTVDHSVDQVAGSLNIVLSQSSSVRDSAMQSNAHIKHVITNLDEMAEAVREIAQSTQHAADVAGKANERATLAESGALTLKQATDQVQDFLNVIRDISQKSRMLALNASIEAERAGAAGQGFAVVADEVKQLASQTEEAAYEAESKLEGVTGSSNQLVTSLKEISDLIGEVSEASVAISSAIDEQDAVAHDIRERTQVAGDHIQQMEAAASSMVDCVEVASIAAADARSGAKSVSGDISGVNGELDRNRGDVNRVAQSANDISDIAKLMQTMVGNLVGRRQPG